ncbi:hypothetical protein ATCC90586_004256 [Pythium insidiosum]|nr:hypothetical protein ATCC90586_004256 [Pythium insidiosum]
MTAVVIDHEDIPVETSSSAGAAPAPASVAPVSKRRRDVRQNVNRPDNSRWTQQRFRVWEPMLTLNWSIAICFVVAASCTAIGIAMVLESSTLTTYRVVYDDGGRSHMEAKAVQPDGTVQDLDKCLLDSPGQANSFHADHTCLITITLREPIAGPAYVFYELSDLHQHHRRFVSSMDRTQFTDEWRPGVLLTTCDPMAETESEACDIGFCSAASKQRRDYFPCGIVANTMFNDIFWLHDGMLPSGERLTRRDLVSRGVARTYAAHNTKNPTWDLPLDKFLPVWRNPNFSRIIPPPPSAGVDLSPSIAADYTNSTAWVHDPLDPDHGVGTGVENEHWRVWVETAAIEPFRKPYGRIQRDLPAGTTLTFAVQSNYFVRSFKGRKALVVGELSWFGSENYAMGIFFLGVAVIFFTATLLFGVRRCVSPRRLGDASVLAWKHELYGKQE